MDLKAFARGEDIGPFMNFAAPSQDEGREPGHGTLSRLIG
jgi:hypothetical protein